MNGKLAGGNNFLGRIFCFHNPVGADAQSHGFLGDGKLRLQAIAILGDDEAIGIPGEGPSPSIKSLTATRHLKKAPALNGQIQVIASFVEAALGKNLLI